MIRVLFVYPRYLSDNPNSRQAERYTPSLIIYDVTPEYDYLSYLSDGDLIRYTTPLKPYASNSNVANHIKSFSERERLFLYSSLYRYNSIGLTVCKDYLTSSAHQLNSYAPLYGTMEEVVLLDETEGINLHKSKCDCFRDLIQLCIDMDIPIVLVASPKLGAQESGIYEWCRGVADEFEIPFYDFYADASFSMDPTLFHDQPHLNNTGAQKFTLTLLSELKEGFNHSDE